MPHKQHIYLFVLDKHWTLTRLSRYMHITSDPLVACTCGGSQTLQNFASRGYHPTTHKVNSVRA